MVWETLIICCTIYGLAKPWISEKVRQMEIDNDEREEELIHKDHGHE